MTDTRATTEKLRELGKSAFKRPWYYEKWEIECGYGDCEVEHSEEHEGTPHNASVIMSPDYPGEQVVAEIIIPGLEDFADANGKYICEAINALPALLDRLEKLERVAEAGQSVDAEFDGHHFEDPFRSALATLTLTLIELDRDT